MTASPTFSDDQYDRVALLLDRDKPAWILRRNEQLTLYQDHVVNHEIRFDCEAKRRAGDPTTKDDTWHVPLLYLPKRTLFRLSLTQDGRALPILAREQNEELAVEALLRLAKTLKTLSAEDLKLLRTDLENVVKCDIEKAAETLENLHVLGMFACKAKLWKLVCLLAYYRLHFVELPPTRQVVTFMYSEYVDLGITGNWVDEPAARQAMMQKPDWPTSPSVGWFPRRWSRLVCPVTWVAIPLLPVDSHCSYRLELEAPPGVDIADARVRRAVDLKSFSVKPPGTQEECRYPHSVEGELKQVKESVRGQRENAGILAHLHYGPDEIEAVGPPAPCAVVVELRTPVRGAIASLRRTSFANAVVAALAAWNMRKLIVTDADAVVAVLLAVPAAITVVLSRGAGGHAIGSRLLRFTRYFAFGSAVGLFFMAVLVVLFSVDEIGGRPPVDVLQAAWLLAFGVIGCYVMVWRNSRHSTRSAVLDPTGEIRYPRRLVVGFVVLALLVAAYGTTAQRLKALSGFRVHYGPSPSSADTLFPPPPDDVLPSAFEPGHRLLLGFELKNATPLGITVTGVKLDEHLPFTEETTWIARHNEGRTPGPLEPFRAFPLPGNQARHVEIEVRLGHCAAAPTLRIARVRADIRTFEVHNLSGVSVRLPTPIVLQATEDELCDR